MKYMLDTNICIYAIKGGNAQLDQRLDERETGDLVMSAMTLAELEAGFAKSNAPDAARAQAAAVFGSVNVVAFDEAAARAFGRVQSEAPARAWSIRPADRRTRHLARPDVGYKQRAGLRRHFAFGHRELDQASAPTGSLQCDRGSHTLTDDGTRDESYSDRVSWLLGPGHYSPASAATGSSRDARRAGTMPAAMPVATPQQRATGMNQPAKATGTFICPVGVANSPTATPVV